MSELLQTTGVASLNRPGFNPGNAKLRFRTNNVDHMFKEPLIDRKSFQVAELLFLSNVGQSKIIIGL